MSDSVVAKMCAILDQCSPGWYETADPDLAPSEAWKSEINARLHAGRDERKRAKPLDASSLVEKHLADCLPPGTPPYHRAILTARYVGTGRKRVAIANVEMFDGLPATVEVFRWGANAFGHRWTAMEGGAVYFEDDRWHRDEAAGRLLDGRTWDEFPDVEAPAHV